MVFSLVKQHLNEILVTQLRINSIHALGLRTTQLTGTNTPTHMAEHQTNERWNISRKQNLMAFLSLPANTSVSHPLSHTQQ